MVPNAENIHHPGPNGKRLLTLTLKRVLPGGQYHECRKTILEIGMVCSSAKAIEQTYTYGISVVERCLGRRVIRMKVSSGGSQ